MRLACLYAFMLLLITSFCAAQSPRPLGPAPVVWLSAESTSTVNNSIGVDTGGIYWDDLFGSKTYFKNLAVSTGDNDFDTTQTVYGLAVEGPGGVPALKINTEEIRIDDSHVAAVYTESIESADTTLTLGNNGTHQYELLGTTYYVPARLNLEIDGKLGVSGGKAYTRATMAAGDGAIASGTGSIALQNSASATNGGTAIGVGATANDGVAIGEGASASTLGVALGAQSDSTGNNSVAFQYGVASGAGSFAGPSSSGNSNEAIGPYSSALGPKNIARGYAAHNHSDNSTIDSLTGFGGGGGHNTLHNKGPDIAGAYSGSAGADSFWLGGAYNDIQGLRTGTIGAFIGYVYGDYSLGMGMYPRISAAHDGAFVFNGVTNGDTSTNTTGVNQAIFFGKGIESGGQVAIKGQPLTTATLTVWGGAAVAGAISTTGTLQGAAVQTKGAVWRYVAGATMGAIAGDGYAADGWTFPSGSVIERIIAFSDGARVYAPIDKDAGTVISRIRVKWENETGSGSPGVLIRLLRRDESSSAAVWTVVGTQQVYTSGSSGVTVSTYDITDHTMLADNVYVIEVEGDTDGGTCLVGLYSVGYETTTRIY